MIIANIGSIENIFPVMESKIALILKDLEGAVTSAIG